MDHAALQAYVLAKPGATETYPFGPQPLVAKVMGKMFALLAQTSTPPQISLKCDPAMAQFLRDEYPAVQAGYHLDKRHWNTVTLDGSVPADELRGMVDESYMLVVQGLTRAQRHLLNEGETTA